MHIVIDASCLGRKKTGNETYIRGLLSGLESLLRQNDLRVSPECEMGNAECAMLQNPTSRIPHPESSVPPPSSRISAFKPQLSGFQLSLPSAGRFRFTILTTSAYTGDRAKCFDWQDISLGNFLTRNFLSIPSALRALEPDLYHGVYWSRFVAQPVPTVLMVHDLSFISFPQGLRAHEQFVYANLVRACARAACHVLTVSQFSKQELMKHWRIPSPSITVTYNGLDACYQSSRSAPTVEETPYILYVGNLHPRKNLLRLLDAFVQVRRSGYSHRLKIVGQAAWLADEIFSAVRQSGISDNVDFTGYVSYEKLASIYQNAAVCVYPSLYEGFGLPVLEAMACGCPVVCSMTTSLPEVAGDACFLVDPESTTEIAEGIRSVLSDPILAGDLRRRGLIQAEKFTWEQCAKATLDAYANAMKNGET